MTGMIRRAPIYSQLGGDRDLAELVTLFVDELPERMTTLQEAFSKRDLELLRRTAHQLKGALGSYGFDQLTPLAAAVEHAVLDESPEAGIATAVQQLISACRHVRAGQPNACVNS